MTKRMQPLGSSRTPLTLWRVGLRLLLLATAVALVPARAAEPLHLAVSRTPLSLPLYVAQVKGYFAAENIDVRISECIGGQRCMVEMFEGRADLATATELPVVFNAFSRTDHVIIGTFVSSVDDLKIVARPGSGVSTVAQLAGKRIGTVAGTSSQYYLDLTLLAAGVDPRTLDIVPLQPEQMVEALRTGRVDAAAIWEPFGFMALAQGGKRLPSAGGYVETFNLISHRRLLGTRAAELARLLRAVERAEQHIAAQPEDAKAILRQRLQLEQAFVDWVWPGLAFRLGLSQSLIATMESQARWAQREGHLPPRVRPNFLDLVDTVALQAAKPAAVGITR